MFWNILMRHDFKDPPRHRLLKRKEHDKRGILLYERSKYSRALRQKAREYADQRSPGLPLVTALCIRKTLRRRNLDDVTWLHTSSHGRPQKPGIARSRAIPRSAQGPRGPPG